MAEKMFVNYCNHFIKLRVIIDHKNIFGKIKRFNADDKDSVCSGFVKWVNTDPEFGLDSRNLSSGICEQQRSFRIIKVIWNRWNASAQSDQRLCYSIIVKYHI